MKVFQHSGQYGDLKKFSVKIQGKDVTSAITSLNVFQDIFTPTTTAMALVNDTNNLLMNIPIRAGSEIEIEYETEHNSPNDGEKTWKMVIYKVGEKTVHNSKHQTYSIYASHEALMKNQVKKIVKVYKNQPGSSIVSSIVGEFLGGEVETTGSEGNVTVIVPNWTPFYAINWVAKFSLSSNAADYVFFQNHEDTFVYKPFEQLFAESEVVTFTIKPTAIRDDAGNIDGDYTTITGRYQFEHFDALANLSSGYYRSKLFTYDFIEKKWENSTFRFGDDCGADAAAMKTDDQNLLQAEDANVSFYPLHPEMMDAGPSYLDKSEDWVGSRKSSLQKFEQEKLLIQLPGSGKCCEWFGKSCVIDLPAQDSISKEEFDTQRRGKYLIASIGHMFTGGTYTANFELVKKRLEKA